MQLYNPASGFTTIDNRSYGYYFATGGSTKVTILNNGNLGINTTSPGQNCLLWEMAQELQMWLE